ncbi:MAG: Crp/Fnr family transcriptional regulator [Cytophagales bacterium]|nr:Crp/Fnr family transcriptional regulator [Cytophagales bacterium]
MLEDILREKYKIKSDNLDKLISLFEPINYPKNAFLIQQRELSECLFFISKGLAREYYTFDNVHDEDNTTQFIREDEFYFSINCYIDGKRSECFTQALEPVKAYIITKENLERYSEEIPEIQQLINNVLKDCLLRLSNRIHLFMKSRKSSDRYELFKIQNPEITHRVSDKYIASYLQINSSTLSRIRTGGFA